jgi:hypothetical protein
MSILPRRRRAGTLELSLHVLHLERFDGVPVEPSVIPSFFEIKEVGGVRTLSEKNRIVGF